MRKVLVVDNDPVFLANMERILGTAGYETLTARDGVEGLLTYRANQQAIGLLILDLDLPRMGGLAVAKVIRKADLMARIVLLCQPTLGLQEGIAPDDFLPKPVRVGDLLETVQRLLGDELDFAVPLLGARTD